jgi:hypothetical protein
MVSLAENNPSLYPAGMLPSFSPVSGSPPHNASSNAIFASYYSQDFFLRKIHKFVGTCRLHFRGDIVIGINTELAQDSVDLLLSYGVIVYKIPMNCKDNKFDLCQFTPEMALVPPAQVRYYVYQKWAALYNRSTRILLTDARDVIFQSDPFLYRRHEWSGADLVAVLEPHPNKVINRCPFNSGWIESCYGKEGLQLIGHRVVSCSGTTMGSRNGILVYVSAVVA